MFFGAIGAEGFILAGREIRQCGVRPNLAMRMRVACAHKFAAVFKDLHVTNPGDLREGRKLPDPGVNHAAQFLSVHSRNGQIVTRREAQDAADAAVGLGDKQAILPVLQPLNFGQQRGKIVVERVSCGVGRRLLAASALVPRAQIAVGIVSNRRRRRKLLDFSLPGAPGALWRDKDPLPQQRVEAFVRSGKELFKVHDDRSS